jgi:hypothetical protein
MGGNRRKQWWQHSNHHCCFSIKFFTLSVIEQWCSVPGMDEMTCMPSRQGFCFMY